MDLYRLLNVSRSVTAKELKQAYRKLAMQYHPDRHPAGPARVEAEAKFKTITNAYQKLLEIHAKGGHEPFGASKHDDSMHRQGRWTPRDSHYQEQSFNEAAARNFYHRNAYASGEKASTPSNNTRDERGNQFNQRKWTSAHYGEEEARREQEENVWHDSSKSRTSSSSSQHQNHHQHQSSAAEDDKVSRFNNRRRGMYTGEAAASPRGDNKSAGAHSKQSEHIQRVQERIQRNHEEYAQTASQGSFSFHKSPSKYSPPYHQQQTQQTQDSDKSSCAIS